MNAREMLALKDAARAGPVVWIGNPPEIKKIGGFETVFSAEHGGRECAIFTDGTGRPLREAQLSEFRKMSMIDGGGS